MFPQWAFFDLGSFIALWCLSVIGGIAVLLSWMYVEPEFEEGVLTRGGRSLVIARLLLTLSCMVFWICTLLGHVLNDSKGDAFFGFWREHPVLLLTLLSLVDPFLITAGVFAWQSRGGGRWILWIAPPVIALASIAASIVLCTS